MHPDQATESIVDFALHSGLPFAVVPCCVFRHSFLQRRLPCGAAVRTREQLVQYLQHKAPGSSVAWLPFLGADQVVYRLPLRSVEGLDPAVCGATTAPWWDERGGWAHTRESSESQRS